MYGARMINMKDPSQCQNGTAERLAPAGSWQRRNGPRHESMYSRTSDDGCHGWIYGRIWSQANGFQLSISSFLGLPGITSASCLKPRGLEPTRAIVSVVAEHSWLYCSLEAFLRWISGLATNGGCRIHYRALEKLFMPMILTDCFSPWLKSVSFMWRMFVRGLHDTEMKFSAVCEALALVNLNESLPRRFVRCPSLTATIAAGLVNKGWLTLPY
jgi:hypothetical protein